MCLIYTAVKCTEILLKRYLWTDVGKRRKVRGIISVPVVNINQTRSGLIMPVVVWAFNYIQPFCRNFNNRPRPAYTAKFAIYCPWYVNVTPHVIDFYVFKICEVACRPSILQ